MEQKNNTVVGRIEQLTTNQQRIGLSAAERLVIPFGKKVKVTQQYYRRITGRKKEYVPKPFEATGIFLGWRTISNGATYCDYEEGCHWEADKYLQAALVAFSPIKNPMYIPSDSIEV